MRVALVVLAVVLYVLVGVLLRFCVCLTTGEDPVDAMRPRRAMLRDAVGWPVLALFVACVVVAEGSSVGHLALEYRRHQRRKRVIARSLARRRGPWPTPTRERTEA